MITKTFYMGEYSSELEIVIRGDDIYITDADDDECVCIPIERLQRLREDVDIMIAEQKALPRELK